MSQLLKVKVLVNKEGHGFQMLIKFKYILIDTSIKRDCPPSVTVDPLTT